MCTCSNTVNVPAASCFLSTAVVELCATVRRQECDVCQFVGKHRTSHFASLSKHHSKHSLFPVICMNCLLSF